MTVLPATTYLFDSDGVLVDSDAAVEEVWHAWALAWDLDPATVVPEVHGTPSRLTVARFVPEAHRDEALAMVDRLEVERADTVTALPGAVDLLASLQPGTWAVVTSGTGPLARTRLAAAGIAPPVLVTADDVEHGKPAPDPYLAAAARLGSAPDACVVFEDSEPGVRAARAAEVAHVVGVTRRQEGVDAFAPDLRSIRIADGTVTVG